MPIPDEFQVESPVEAPAKRKRGRPKKGEEKPKLPAVTKAQASPFSESGAAVRGGVTVNWLAQALGKDKRTIESRVSALRPIRIEGRYKYYDFMEAISKFVAPSAGVTEFLANARPSDLPMSLQLGFWLVQKEKMAVAAQARDTFRGEDFREVLQRFAYLSVESLKTMTSHMKRIAPDDLQEKFDNIQDAQIVKLRTDSKTLVQDFIENLSVLDEIAKDEQEEGEQDDIILDVQIEDSGITDGDYEE